MLDGLSHKRRRSPRNSGHYLRGRWPKKPSNDPLITFSLEEARTYLDVDARDETSGEARQLLWHRK